MELIWFLIGAALTIVPMWKLTERAGLNPMWSLVSITGIGLIVLLWVLALRPGPGSA
jgi:hypothetical protein